MVSSVPLEGHIHEDVTKCITALNETDADSLDRTAGAIRGRAARVCNVVSAEMENYQPGVYTDRVMEAVFMLRDQGTYIYYLEALWGNVPTFFPVILVL